MQRRKGTQTHAASLSFFACSLRLSGWCCFAFLVFLGSGGRTAIRDHFDAGNFEMLFSLLVFLFLAGGFFLADIGGTGPSAHQFDLMAHMVLQLVVSAHLKTLGVLAVGQRIHAFVVWTCQAACDLVLAAGLGRRFALILGHTRNGKEQQ